MIFVTITAISIYCLGELSSRDWSAPDPGYVPLNHRRYWDMIGFSFFMFEGIGCVMPVMNACDQRAREKFPYLLVGALTTLCTTYVLFS